MKLLQITCLSLFMSFAVGCKDTVKEAEIQQTNETVPDTLADTLKSKEALHTTENSLDWTGLYSGTSPCADCPGIKTDITLNSDTTYTLQEQYLEKEKMPRSFKGSFYWDDTKSVITLDAEGDHHKFKVAMGKLIILDKFGDPKQGGKEEDFTLHKIK